MAHSPRMPGTIVDLGMEAMFGGTICQSALIEVYDNSDVQPAAGGGAIGGCILLATLTMDAVAPWTGASSGGILTASAITQDSDADASGTALWFRLKTAGGTALIDGSVGVGAAFDMNINSTAIVQHGIVACNSLVITHPLL